MECSTISELVAELPEIYQPVFGHPEYSKSVSRISNDRLVHLINLQQALQLKLGRPLRVLDLGCAQGFFSFHLASRDASVTGIDHLQQNINLCQALSAEKPLFKLRFEVKKIEDALNALETGQYDLVLALSVFHHIIYANGFEIVHRLIGILAKKISICVFEFGEKSEPVFWSDAQPERSKDLLHHFAFTHVLGEHPTHLSSVPRSFVFASNHFCYFGAQCHTFEHWKTESHALNKGVHQGTRRYFFGENKIIKYYSFALKEMYSINIDEYKNEMIYLQKSIKALEPPQLYEYGSENNQAWIVREALQGKPLIDIIRAKESYNAIVIIQDILEQLILLEEHGLYHNDVRSWNIIVPKTGKVRLIDYGSISEKALDCLWPKNIYLSFILFMLELFEPNSTSQLDCLRLPLPSLNIEVLPTSYQSALIHFLKCPVSSWCYKNFAQSLKQSQPEMSEENQEIWQMMLLFSSTLEEGFKLYKRQMEFHFLSQSKMTNPEVHTLKERLLKIEKSRYWRIRQPVKFCAQILRHRSLKAQTIIVLIIKKILTNLIRLIRACPPLKKLAIFLLKRYPKLGVILYFNLFI